MNDNAETKIIVSTLLFFLKLRYPPTINELYNYSVTEKAGEKIDKNAFDLLLYKLISLKEVVQVDKYYFLQQDIDVKKIQDLIKERIDIEKERSVRIKKAKNLFVKLQKHKFIKFIAINNIYSKDDTKKPVRLYVVAGINRVWITKLYFDVYLMFFNIKNKYKVACVMQEDELVFKRQRMKNVNKIELAFDLINLIPLYPDNQSYILSYSKLVKDNMWIYEFFSNFGLNKLGTKFKSVEISRTNKDKNGIKDQFLDWFNKYLFDRRTVRKDTYSQYID